ncbi:hypothetical protein [Streptomyces sp. NBC_00304]|uniref:hypothetical protein n=1 Tax=Streptomyces sp. NBC_00304 TaxID=2975706 RepID=UPI002E2C556B|nr:hypothetical protein [Streptomyces sp. NBC_00304]
MLGLRWQDVDFENRQFMPVKQVQREKGVGLVLKDLKTESSQAVLPLPEFFARARCGSPGIPAGPCWRS